MLTLLQLLSALLFVHLPHLAESSLRTETVCEGSACSRCVASGQTKGWWVINTERESVCVQERLRKGERDRDTEGRKEGGRDKQGN